MRIPNVAVSLLCLGPAVSAFQSTLLPKATKSGHLGTSLASSGTFRSNFKSFLVGPSARKAAMESSSAPPPPSSIPEPVVPSAQEVIDAPSSPMEALNEKIPQVSLEMPSLSLPDDISFDVSSLRDTIKLPSISTPDIALPDASDITKFMSDIGFQFRPLEVDLSGISERDVSPEIAELPVFPMDKLISSLMQMETIFVEGDPLQVTLGEYLNVLNLQELGPWYLGAFAFLALTSAVGRSNAAPVDSYRPFVFSSASGLSTDESKAVEQLEEQVKQLSDATNVVMKELRQLKEEKIARENQMTMMQEELASMKTRLEEAEAKGRQLQADLDAALKTSNKQAKELEMLTKQKEQLEKDLAEAKTIQLELEKALKAKTVAPKAPMYRAAAPKAPMYKAAASKAPMYKAAAPTSSPQPVTEKLAAAQMKTVTKADKDVEIISTTRNLPQNVSEAFFVSPVLGATEKKSKLKGETAHGANGEDWSNLSLSTLKRKTVKDLAEYLEAKGTSTIGDDGKMMKKAELVEAVLTIK